jgi:hypothetical protein
MIPPATNLKTPGLAIASLICGIGGFFTCLLTGIPAIITGHLALGKIQREPGSLKGTGIAMTGLVLGYVTTVASILLIPLAAIATPSVFKALERAKTVQNISSSRQMHLGLQMYASDHEGKYPSDLEALDASGPIGSMAALSYKGDNDTPLAWIYFPGLDDTSDPQAIILASPETFKQNREPSRIVVRVDGSVKTISELEYQSLIRAQSPEAEARE